MQLHVIHHGPPPARFVLVHGLASNARLWDGVGVALAARNVGSLAVDLRGHGRSPKPDVGYDHATVVADVLEVLPDDPVVVVGQSWGASVVVELAVRHPERVQAVVCVDGGVMDLQRRFDSWEACREALTPPHMEGTPVAEIERWMREHRDWPEAGIAGALGNYEILGDRTVRPWLTRARHLLILRSLWEYRPEEMWPRLTTPITFLTASENLRPGVERALAVMPHASARWFDGADHDLHAQHPDQVASALLDALPS